jgi:hypothetical protein
MKNIIKFQKSPQNYKEFHFMSCTLEDDWIVWRCHECSRKVKSHVQTSEFIVERQGNFFAHHDLQLYQPSPEEWEAAGLEPAGVEIDLNFSGNERRRKRGSTPPGAEPHPKLIGNPRKKDSK